MISKKMIANEVFENEATGGKSTYYDKDGLKTIINEFVFGMDSDTGKYYIFYINADENNFQLITQNNAKIGQVKEYLNNMNFAFNYRVIEIEEIVSSHINSYYYNGTKYGFNSSQIYYFREDNNTGKFYEIKTNAYEESFKSTANYITDNDIKTTATTIQTALLSQNFTVSSIKEIIQVKIMADGYKDSVYYYKNNNNDMTYSVRSLKINKFAIKQYIKYKDMPADEEEWIEAEYPYYLFSTNASEADFKEATIGILSNASYLLNTNNINNTTYYAEYEISQQTVSNILHAKYFLNSFSLISSESLFREYKGYYYQNNIAKQIRLNYHYAFYPKLLDNSPNESKNKYYIIDTDASRNVYGRCLYNANSLGILIANLNVYRKSVIGCDSSLSGFNCQIVSMQDLFFNPSYKEFNKEYSISSKLNNTLGHITSWHSLNIDKKYIFKSNNIYHIVSIYNSISDNEFLTIVKDKTSNNTLRDALIALNYPISINDDYGTFGPGGYDDNNIYSLDSRITINLTDSDDTFYKDYKGIYYDSLGKHQCVAATGICSVVSA